MGAPLNEVDILLDGWVVCEANLGGYRPDVQDAWGAWAPGFDITFSGWDFSYNIGWLSPGDHTLTAFAYDDHWLPTQLYNTWTFTVLPMPTPTTSISASASSIYVNSSVTVTAFTDGNGVNLDAQTIDYSTDGGNSWVSGTEAAGSRWDGCAPNNTLVSTFSFGSAQTVTFRARGEIQNGPLSDFVYATVDVTLPPPPTIAWANTPGSVVANQAYTIGAQAHDSSGLLASISITKNGHPFASSGGGNGSTSSASGSSADAAGTVTYTAKAMDSLGYASSTLTWTVTVAKATPVVSHWASRAIANNTGYAVTAADLTAIFSNPYGNSPTTPTGAVVYSIVSDSTGTFPAGTVITPTSNSVLQPGNYTICASYPGDSNYNARAVDVTWIISNPVTLNTASATTVFFGQTVTITSLSADKDNLLVSEDIDYLPPPGSTWVTGASTWSGGPVGSNTLTWTMPTSIFNIIGQWQVRGSGTNNQGFVSPYLSILSITLAKATPAISNWSNQTFPTTHVVTAADISAAFANPYTSSVAQPTGAVTYSIVSGGSGPVTVGTKLYPGTYTIRASYPGDTNYTPLTTDIVWTIINHPPVTALTASVMNIAPGQSVTLTASATDIDGNMTSQTIDYLSPGSSSWVIGGATWSGAMTGSNTLTWTVPGSILNTPGVWKFRSTGGDGMAAPNYASVSVMVAFGITGPTGLKIYRPAQ